MYDTLRQQSLERMNYHRHLKEETEKIDNPNPMVNKMHEHFVTKFMRSGTIARFVRVLL